MRRLESEREPKIENDFKNRKVEKLQNEKFAGTLIIHICCLDKAVHFRSGFKKLDNAPGAGILKVIPRIRRKSNIRFAWDKIAQPFHEYTKPLFHKADFLWGPYGPKESDVKLLGSVNGKEILVLGCGSGNDVVWLTKHGSNVTGLDISSKQLDIARNQLTRSGLHASLVRVNLNHLAAFERGTRQRYDVVISNYSLQYIEKLDRLFRTAYRLLRPHGEFIFSFDHPVLYATYRAYQKRGRRKSMATFDYLNERVIHWTFRITGVDVPAYSYHRRIDTILNALIESGFKIQKVIEPSPSIRSVGNYRRTYHLAKRLPYTLLIKAEKI
jgi:ubiquinone/menaquinone biosynthesis C-methylase UbiE